MGTKFFAPLAVTLLLFACNDLPAPVETKSTDTPIAAVVDPAPETIVYRSPDTVVSCYRFDKDIEHHWMKMTRVGDTAYGELHYTWEGKDGANGPFHGKFSGDTLWILFNSYGEGEYIDIERAYLVSGEKLLEGQGMQESNKAGNYYYFKHKKLIEFSQKEYLAKGPCM